MKFLYRVAQSAVSVTRLVSTTFYISVAALLISIAVWLVMPPGQNWFLGIVAILVGVRGAAFGVKGLEIFLSMRPAEKPSGRQNLPPGTMSRRPSPRDRRRPWQDDGDK